MNDYSNNTYEASIASNFIRSVYSYMFIAMAISGVIAYAVGTNKALFDQLFMTSDGGTSPVFYVMLFAPIVISKIGRAHV